MPWGVVCDELSPVALINCPTVITPITDNGWLNRLGELAEIFAIDILAYVIMSNHYHLMVRLRPEQAQVGSGSEVIVGVIYRSQFE